MTAASNCLAPAAVRLTMRYPFWSELFYSMGVVETDECETAATDGRKFWVNPGFWKTLSLEHQVGVAIHELCHKMYLHCTRQGSRDSKLWNVACDYAINGLLHENNISLPEPHLYDAKYAGMLAEAIYSDLAKQMKAMPQTGQASGKGQAVDGKGNPIPGVSEAWDKLQDIKAQQGTPEGIERLETEIKASVDRAVANAKAQGTLPAGIEAGVVQVYKPNNEPWYNRLHRYMQALSTSTYNWARLNRRTLRSHGCFSPLHQSEALGDIALFIDTSGSCFDAAEQANFAGHLNAILAEAKPHRIHLYYFDTRVYPGDVIEAGELDISTRPKGGGGTSFEPIFAQIEEDGLVLDVVIVLTDLYGSFPAAPPEYPVVWACTTDVVAPFGETIGIGD